MTTSEKFCLRWNDFESNISVAFREIREEKDFFDVTLSVGDRQVQAHKIILSACSPFFRGILRNNPHAHPLLYLKGVAFTDLTAVLNFMYHGEVNVAQEELNSFLAVAEDLKVKGLTQGNSSKDSNPAPPPPVSNPTSRQSVPIRPRSPPRHASPAPKRPRPPPTYEEDIQEVAPIVKTEPVATIPEPPPHHSYGAGQGQESALAHMEEGAAYDDGYDYGGYEEEEGYEGGLVGPGGEQNKGEYGNHLLADPDSFITELRTEEGNLARLTYACAECGKTAKSRGDLKKHVLSKHIQGPPVTCPYCSRTYKNSPSLQAHISQSHRDGNRSHSYS